MSYCEEASLSDTEERSLSDSEELSVSDIFFSWDGMVTFGDPRVIM